MIERVLLLLAQTKPKNCDPSINDATCQTILPQVSANASSIQTILSIVFGVFAAVAVLVIILAGINFAASEGKPENISKAKNTIIYALIGLVISLLAEALVLTVLGRL